MHETSPSVHLVARPQLIVDNLWGYLEDIGGESWIRRQGDMLVGEGHDGEVLVEIAGRLCYKSWEPGLNPNVTKIREDSLTYLQNIIKSGHGAVLEHSNYSFIFHNVSRVFTHELVRHRAGVAISQESLRYVRLVDLGFRIPEILLGGPDQDSTEKVAQAELMRSSIVNVVETLEEFQRNAAQAFGLDDEGTPFHYKKEVTSALRRLAPLGLSTEMIWTANIRTLRHVISMRTAEGAEEEIRSVFDDVAHLMLEECPYIFSDYSRTDAGVWITPNFKV